MRLMSFALKTEQIRSRTATVTRRMGWDHLVVGDLLQPIVKGQGLKRGQRVERINGPIRVVSVGRDPLRRLLQDREYGRREVDLEGFPDQTIDWFVAMFLRTHAPCTLDSAPNRIAFEYVQGARAPARHGDHYDHRLTVTLERDALVVRIGVQTLAHAVTAADWAHEACDDEGSIRTFAIADAHAFARDVGRAMQAEREDGSCPLTDFVDRMSIAAIDDGSLGIHESDHRIPYGATAPCEHWAPPKAPPPQESPNDDYRPASRIRIDGPREATQDRK